MLIGFYFFFSQISLKKTWGVIVVSFGTLSDVEDIPVAKLQSFVKTFAIVTEYIFIWHLDVPMEYFQKSILDPIGMTLPKNVRLYRWIPMKQLLMDPKVVIVITHGGASTCLEATYSGTPILGIAIHSDQFSNTQRFEHRGLRVALTVMDIDDEYTIKFGLDEIIFNYKK